MVDTVNLTDLFGSLKKLSRSRNRHAGSTRRDDRPRGPILTTRLRTFDEYPWPKTSRDDDRWKRRGLLSCLTL